MPDSGWQGPRLGPCPAQARIYQGCAEARSSNRAGPSIGISEAPPGGPSHASRAPRTPTPARATHRCARSALETREAKAGPCAPATRSVVRHAAFALRAGRSVCCCGRYRGDDAPLSWRWYSSASKCPSDFTINPSAPNVQRSWPERWTARPVPPGPVLVPVQVQWNTVASGSSRSASSRIRMSGNAAMYERAVSTMAARPTEAEPFTTSEPCSA